MTPIGTIFADKKSGFWKVTGPKRKSFGYGESYPVIKCTKYGKEFQRSNGFSDTYVDGLFKEGKTWAATDNTEVSTDGQAVGALKRRVLHLEGRIASDTAEVAKLLKQIEQLSTKD